ncbi:hypothetical protein TNCV_3108661 [Trichonephila clavipes]|uniref:Uncharacterized protein n=1 Tax=Trichonephila clavipes TaxID=2585209 RepID=A0A8X6V627_TRICX|nr:hypothetical protein TNCV_3108661 [Trichonephila clavipes]
MCNSTLGSLTNNNDERQLFMMINCLSVEMTPVDVLGFQECDEEDVEILMAEDCRFQMQKDEEIVTSVQEESDSVDDETDEDEDVKI